MSKAVQFSLFTAAPNARWGAHNGYTPSRYWLIKGVRAVASHPQTFTEETYWLKFGVSKSMGEALKLWCEAFKLIEPKDKHNTYYQPTPLAVALLGEEGQDPYLEDPQSLWILQWHLLTPPCLLPNWEWFFTRFYKSDFKEHQATRALQEHYEKQGIKVSPTTVAADMKCILKMYVEQGCDASRINEEQLMRPFPELGYVSLNPSSLNQDKEYRVNVGQKNGITSLLFLYLCVKYIQTQHFNSNSIGLNHLMFDPTSPGIVLKLSITDMMDLIDKGLRQVDGLQASYTARINLLQWNKPLAEIEHQLLNLVYDH
jgi:Protein of unknown function (DUF4007)